MAKKKDYRRFIRIDGRIESSPRFKTKRDADLWYDQMKRQKSFSRFGFKVSDSKDITFLTYSRDWIKKRMENYPAATWKADEQRLRDYLLPELADIPLNRISSKGIRLVLAKAEKSGLSIETVTRIKALASKIFSDAFNEEVIETNPVYGIRLGTRRKGKKKPEFLSTEDAIKLFESSKEFGPSHQFIVMCGLFLGMRKSEILGLQFDDFDLKNNIVTIRRRLEAASLSIKAGTKSGEYEDRVVPVPKHMASEFKAVLKALAGGPFVLRGRDRQFMSPRVFHDMLAEVARKAKLKVASHKLRHTFGREFVISGGSIKVLQAILGHSVSSVTDRYSDLDRRHIGGSSDIVSYGVKRELQE